MKKLIFTSLFIFAAFTLYAQTVPLTLNIENIGSNKGSIVVNICTNVDEFAEREHAFSKGGFELKAPYLLFEKPYLSLGLPNIAISSILLLFSS